MGESIVKYVLKNPPCSQNHIYGINMKNNIQNFLNFHYEAMVHFTKFIVS
jgi:hypothetical protein